jgi:hypothetical protein
MNIHSFKSLLALILRVDAAPGRQPGRLVIPCAEIRWTDLRESYTQ